MRSIRAQVQIKHHSSQACSKIQNTQICCWRTLFSPPFYLFYFYNRSLISQDPELNLLKPGSSCYALPQFPAIKAERNAWLAWPSWARALQLLPKVRHQKPAQNWVALFVSSAATWIQREKKKKKVNDATSHCLQKQTKKKRTHKIQHAKLALRSSPTSPALQSHRLLFSCMHMASLAVNYDYSHVKLST